MHIKLKYYKLKLIKNSSFNMVPELGLVKGLLRSRIGILSLYLISISVEEY